MTYEDYVQNAKPTLEFLESLEPEQLARVANSLNELAFCFPLDGTEKFYEFSPVTEDDELTSDCEDFGTHTKCQGHIFSSSYGPGGPSDYQVCTLGLIHLILSIEYRTEWS
jgi:hypothetical protein